MTVNGYIRHLKSAVKRNPAIGKIKLQAYTTFIKPKPIKK